MATETSTATYYRERIQGTRRLSNYWWATVTGLGGLGFLLAGISSYTHVNLLPFADPTQLLFIPQGIVMGAYGLVGLALSLFLWLLVLWDVGGGYNEFDKDKRQVTIFRWGWPGRDRRVELVYDLDQVQAIRVQVKEGFNPKRALYLRLRGKRDIPLTQVGRPMTLAELEERAARLARFLGVPVEGL
ncbi:MAG: photosystem I assembly protein Ycf4 [Gloeomargarita sp. SKYG116]|nr:photosystem I assembly protein Ycf4 [Gloeomargarita sp. SKYG116]MCS7226587.1 photosystem I assembly protein Ycf4 [Gloeomargarita sp. SKYB31]MDW8400720.1 photosystem I assembly protein Ycf4 [Gloeomargarita sp. SKYGB_i_bin116]